MSANNKRPAISGLHEMMTNGEPAPAPKPPTIPNLEKIMTAKMSPHAMAQVSTVISNLQNIMDGSAMTDKGALSASKKTDVRFR